MTETTTEHTNGRPRWDDLLKQQAQTEARVVALLEADRKARQNEMSGIDRRLDSLSDDVEKVRVKVDDLCLAEGARVQHEQDMSVFVGGIRNWVAVGVSALALLVVLSDRI